jgi:tetratricopeptide (TPR) repeat protein
MRFYRRAIEFDPAFALAHLRLGLQLANLSRYGEAVEELRRAYAARDRASEAERLYITSFYYDRVVRDPIKAAEPLESWRDSYPKSAIPRFTLASLYGRIGRHDQSYVQAKEALRLEPGHALATVCLIDSLMRLGRLDEARRLGEEQAARSPASVILRGVLAQIAFAQGDEAALGRHMEWASRIPAAAPAFLELESSMARFGGRMQDAARVNGERIALAERLGDRILAAVTMLEEASDRARVGQARAAIGMAVASLQRARTPETLARAALVMATVGEADQAEALLREYDALPDVTPASDPDFRPAALALITMTRGFPQSAVEILAPLRPYELGWRFNFLPAYVRGLALLQLQRPVEAAKEFDRICQNRGAVPETLVYALACLQRGRAKSAAGDGKAARSDYEQFLRYWSHADGDLPLLAQAREELARLPLRNVRIAPPE